MDAPPESKDSAEMKAETKTEALTPNAISAIRGLESSETPVAETPQDHTPPPSDAVPDPADRLFTRPSYFEAKEGDRNVEDDMVEGNYDLHPVLEQDKEAKPGDLNWNPSSSGERGG
jgi:hypothetical protein